MNTPEVQPRRLPIGAEVVRGGAGVHFRIWAPRRQKVEVVLAQGPSVELLREPGGHFSGLVTEARDGSLYRYRLDGDGAGGGAFPDPASRFQPEGPHGPSQVVDPLRFPWTDGAWPGAELAAQVISEIHIGTFTREGTWEAARRELPELAAAGITAIEIMPVADFPGRFGWGYDGVGWFAPVALYGGPDDFRRFVDHAHHFGQAVILDVVYNHLGPDGNYWHEYSEDYFTSRYSNEWGEAINFDGPNSCGVRELVIANAAYWAEEYHIDGLRLDATQQIFDRSPQNIMAELTRAFRAAARGRRCFVVAENERQEARLARPVEAGGYGLDGLWNDDFHHSARVAVTGRNEAYYSDYQGTPQELISALKYGYLFQGQRYAWQNAPRGAPALDLQPWQFVTFLDNHDQISNGSGLRLDRLTSPGRYRAITALLLLGPGTPLLFQGQEFASSSPFHFFADHQGELRELVGQGRLKFLSQFPSLAGPGMQARQPDPGEPSTFEKCKLDFTERHTHAPIYRMHRDLLRLRREDPVIRAATLAGREAMDGAVLGPECFVWRYFGKRRGEDRLLLINLGHDLEAGSAAEPLIAPPDSAAWELLWSSEDPRYGGAGTPAPAENAAWRMPGNAAMVLRPEPGTEPLVGARGSESEHGREGLLAGPPQHIAQSKD